MRQFIMFVVTLALVPASQAKSNPIKIDDLVKNSFNQIRKMDTAKKLYQAASPEFRTKDGVRFLTDFKNKILRKKKIKALRIDYSLNRRTIDIRLDKRKITMKVINPKTGQAVINGIPVTLDRKLPPAQNLKKIIDTLVQAEKKKSNAFLNMAVPNAEAFLSGNMLLWGGLLAAGGLALWYFWDDLFKSDEDEQQDYTTAATDADFSFKQGQGAKCLSNGAVIHGKQGGQDVTFRVVTPLEGANDPMGYSYVTKFNGHQSFATMGTFNIGRLAENPNQFVASYSGNSGPAPVEAYQVVHRSFIGETKSLVGFDDPIRAINISGTFSANTSELPDGDPQEAWLRELTAMGECCAKGGGVCKDRDIARKMSTYADSQGRTVIPVRRLQQ